jgi:hypothetical protein
MNPADALMEGVQILRPLLDSHGFRFLMRGEELGSGGRFVWGQFIRTEPLTKDRRLELHYRFGLGLVGYSLGNLQASHEAYMRELGVWEECRYPGFPANSRDGFHALGHDLAFAGDFLWGSANVLSRAAERQAVDAKNAHDDLMACVDLRKLSRMREQFYEMRYREVAAIAAELKYPSRMSPPQQRMVKIALAKIYQASEP